MKFCLYLRPCIPKHFEQLIFIVTYSPPVIALAVYQPLMVLQPTAGGYAPITAATYHLYQQNGVTKHITSLAPNGIDKDITQAITGLVKPKHDEAPSSSETPAQQQQQQQQQQQRSAVSKSNRVQIQSESHDSQSCTQMYTPPNRCMYRCTVEI